MTEGSEEHVIISLSSNSRTPTPVQGMHNFARIEGPSVPLVTDMLKIKTKRHHWEEEINSVWKLLEGILRH